MIIHPVVTIELILAQHGTVFLLMCGGVDELLTYRIHNQEQQLE